MSNSDQNIWFPGKGHGRAASFPITRLGWLLLTVDVPALHLGESTLRGTAAKFSAVAVEITGTLTVTCRSQGEKQYWYWGGE